MFVVKPNQNMPQSDTRHPLISEIPNERRSLYTFGIQDRSSVVFVTLDEADQQLDTNALMGIYKMIESEFELKESGDNQVEVFNTNQLNDINFENDLDSPNFSSPPRNKQKPFHELGMGQYLKSNNNKAGDVPAEYADDPDYYYAIQASLGNEITGQIRDNVSDPLEPGEGDDEFLLQKRAGTGSTGPNSAKSLDFCNVSMDNQNVPQVQESALQNNMEAQEQKKTTTRVDYAKEIRERKLERFEAKREHAQ